MIIAELPETDGGGSISLVYLTRSPGEIFIRRTPHCVLHGAMKQGVAGRDLALYHDDVGHGRQALQRRMSRSLFVKRVDTY